MEIPTAADIAYQQAHIDDNAIPGIITANVICIVAAWIAVALRLYSRRLVRIPIITDDWLIVASVVRQKGTSGSCSLISFSRLLLYISPVTV